MEKQISRSLCMGKESEMCSLDLTALVVSEKVLKQSYRQWHRKGFWALCKQVLLSPYNILR